MFFLTFSFRLVLKTENLIVAESNKTEIITGVWKQALLLWVRDFCSQFQGTLQGEQDDFLGNCEREGKEFFPRPSILGDICSIQFCNPINSNQSTVDNGTSIPILFRRCLIVSYYILQRIERRVPTAFLRDQLMNESTTESVKVIKFLSNKFSHCSGNARDWS